MVLMGGATACASDYMLQYNTRPRETAMPVLCVVVLRLCCLFSLSLSCVVCVCNVFYSGRRRGDRECPVSLLAEEIWAWLFGLWCLFDDGLGIWASPDSVGNGSFFCNPRNGKRVDLVMR